MVEGARRDGRPLKRRSPRARGALLAGRLAAATSQRLGRGAGEVIGGKTALRLDPRLLSELASGRTVATVSGTNGKTTTTRLLSAAVASAGPVASNGGGANMAAGVLTALSSGAPDAPAVLEVDEIWLPQVASATRPAAVLLLNITRDQLDRSNETRRIALLWRNLGASLPGAVAVANADDPLVVWAARGFARQRWVGAGQRWTADGTVCPACARLLIRDGSGTRAGWHCTNCDLARPEPDIEVLAQDRLRIGRAPGDAAGSRAVLAAGDVAGDRAGGVEDAAEWSLRLQLPGLVNAGNAAMALAGAAVFGIGTAQALAAMAGVADVAGRYSRIDLGGRRARLLLAKNPAGWLEMLALLESEPPRPVVIHFHARGADGRDPSWLWDVPLERLAGREVRVSGERGEDVAVRLAYAGIPATLHPSAQAAAAATGGPDIDVLATYTAFRELHEAAR